MLSGGHSHVLCDVMDNTGHHESPLPRHSENRSRAPRLGITDLATSWIFSVARVPSNRRVGPYLERSAIYNEDLLDPRRRGRNVSATFANLYAGIFLSENTRPRARGAGGLNIRYVPRSYWDNTRKPRTKIANQRASLQLLAKWHQDRLGS